MSHFWDTGFDVNVKSLNLCRYTFWAITRSSIIGLCDWAGRADLKAGTSHFTLVSHAGFCFPSVALTHRVPRLPLHPPPRFLPFSCLTYSSPSALLPLTSTLRCTCVHYYSQHEAAVNSGGGGKKNRLTKKTFKEKKVDRWNISYLKWIDLTHTYHIVHLFHCQFNFNCISSS